MIDGNIDVELTPNGNLRITADAEARAWFEENKETLTEHMMLWEAFEQFWANGSYYPFDAGYGNPSVGLWSGPCIAEEVEHDGEGQCSIVGRYWAFMNYEVQSSIDILIETGCVLFHKP